jgi:hypothetical protein
MSGCEVPGEQAEITLPLKHRSPESVCAKIGAKLCSPLLAHHQRVVNDSEPALATPERLEM